MKAKLIDTNVLIRFLVEDPKSSKFENIFLLFTRLENKEEIVFIDNLIIFEVYFVLTSYYKVPKKASADRLLSIIEFSGVEMSNKELIEAAFNRLKIKNIDLVDAYLIELALSKNTAVYSNDKDLIKAEIETIRL